MCTWLYPLWEVKQDFLCWNHVRPSAQTSVYPSVCPFARPPVCPSPSARPYVLCPPVLLFICLWEWQKCPFVFHKIRYKIYLKNRASVCFVNGNKTVLMLCVGASMILYTYFPISQPTGVKFASAVLHVTYICIYLHIYFLYNVYIYMCYIKLTWSHVAAISCLRISFFAVNFQAHRDTSDLSRCADLAARPLPPQIIFLRFTLHLLS
jgi:hypothetical protein